MDAYSTEFQLPYSDAPPVLIAGSSTSALARAHSTVAAAGLRVADAGTIEAALPRIQQQGSASAIWLELDEASLGAPAHQLLQRIDEDVRAERYPAVVCAPRELIDDLATLDDSVQQIIDGDEAERMSALALAMATSRLPRRVGDVASERNAERLRQLSDEVGRIAATLARLSTGPNAASPSPIQQPTTPDAPAVSSDTVRAVIRARRLRSRYFQGELFADPAWDMLLDLLQAEIAQLRVPVSSLCIAAAVPATTALRWLKTMVQQGLFVRRADPHDGRRVFVELAPQASAALRRYFAEVGSVAVI
jgi:DNA-binding MarR family transcriptional regulator